MARREIEWTELTDEMVGKRLRIDYAPRAWMAGKLVDVEYRIDEVWVLHLGLKDFAWDTSRKTRIPKLTLLD